MKWINDPAISCHCRFVCTGTEIDDLMEEHYLKFHDGGLDFDNPALDVERFIEEYLRREDIEYDPQATDLPVGVIGATQFNPDGSRLIRISSVLDLQRRTPQGAGRFRFTCAHEVFHALFHGRLFRRGGRSVCLENHINEKVIEPTQSTEDLTEWQANRGAAALLMPHAIFAEHAKREKSSLGTGGLNQLVKNLATRFLSSSS